MCRCIMQGGEGVHVRGRSTRCARAREEESRARAWIRPDSTGVGWAAPRRTAPAGPAARFSKHRKVMKYREHRAKLLMRRGPV